MADAVEVREQRFDRSVFSEAAEKGNIRRYDNFDGGRRCNGILVEEVIGTSSVHGI